MRITFKSIISAFVMIGLVAGVGYAVWMAGMARSTGNVMGTITLDGIEGSLTGEEGTWSSELPFVVDNDSIEPNEYLTWTFHLRPIDGGTAPANLGILVDNMVVTEGDNPQGAIADTSLLTQFSLYELGLVGGTNYKDLIVNSDGDTKITVFDLSYAGQKIPFTTGENYLLTKLTSVPLDENHGDKVQFDLTLTGED